MVKKVGYTFLSQEDFKNLDVWAPVYRTKKKAKDYALKDSLIVKVTLEADND